MLTKTYNIMFDQLNILYPLLITIAIFIVMVVIAKIIKYEKTLKEKNLSIIQFYLDKKFLHNNLEKSFKSPKAENYAHSFLESVKAYFGLDDVKIISKEEMLKDAELSLLFKDKLEEFTTAFLLKPEKDITILYEVLHYKEANDKTEHRLYIYLPPDKIKSQDIKNFIYVKSPRKLNKDELETLDIYIHAAQLFNNPAE
ncbi:MAG TPA: hypothetical protein LFW21_04795 [Rickettsia endosymbiont of Pyrocoelia pectoralis]|nr:hypothetical protein [Rickettsia endosymbiont of Pyrocoelia pectoralis]